MAVFFFVFAVSILIFPSAILKEMSYVPNAINGLTTVASILLGFIGFLLAHAYTSHKNTQFKKWFKPRLMWIFFVAFLGFFLISGSYFLLVNNELIWSFKTAISGWFLMAYLLAESFLVAISDEADYLKKPISKSVKT